MTLFLSRFGIWCEIFCLLVALITIGTVATHCLATEGNLRVSKSIGKPGETPGKPGETPGFQPEGSSDAPKTGSILGRLEIPEIGLSVPILEGDDSSILRQGVGHISGTAFPGGLGNVGLAGHRDTLLRRLQGIKSSMMVYIWTRAGKFSYKVESTEVVAPENVEVLDIGEAPQLTIVTCYPFYFVGPAPQRFIVHAHLVSLIPE
jgi:sortase A